MSARPRKHRRLRITGHTAGIALNAKGSAGATMRSIRRYMHLQRNGASDYVHGTTRESLPTLQGRRPAAKPKEKK